MNELVSKYYGCNKIKNEFCTFLYISITTMANHGMFHYFVLASILASVYCQSEKHEFFYKDLGCALKKDTKNAFECPDFTQKNDVCRFKNKILKVGDSVDEAELKGSCTPHCSCGFDGIINCAHADCFQRIEEGCSRFKYSLDSCCPIGSICSESTFECEVDDEKHKLGERFYTKKSCEQCVCSEGFKKEKPFCKPRKCNDQAWNYRSVANYGAPVFFEGDKCCPAIWTEDEGEEIVEMKKATDSVQPSCKFGKREVKHGFGFEKKVKPYGRTIALKCECTSPPFVICHEVA